MAVRLDQVPALALRPERPRMWLWLSMLPLFLLLGSGMIILFADQSMRQQPTVFWGLALGPPLMGWCLLSFGRALQYIGQQRVADGWDEARAQDVICKNHLGRRSLQLFSVSVYTALRGAQVGAAEQLAGLLKGTKALKAQPFRLGGAMRHSRLPGDRDTDPELVLLEALEQVLADVAQTLVQQPDDQPLKLLLEVDSDLPENRLRRVWQQAWRESGIRQSTVPVKGGGLDAVDHWLDQRADDHAMLLVVAFQFVPDRPEGTAEVVVALLLGNHLTQTASPPVAHLHRPELARGVTAEASCYAVRQALNWVPLDASSIEHVWLTGIDRQCDAAVMAALADSVLPMKVNQGLHNLDSLPCVRL